MTKNLSDPNAHSDETPPPFLLAAVNGHMEAFEVLAPHAEKNSDSLQFELAQVSCKPQIMKY